MGLTFSPFSPWGPYEEMERRALETGAENTVAQSLSAGDIGVRYQPAVLGDPPGPVGGNTQVSGCTGGWPEPLAQAGVVLEAGLPGASQNAWGRKGWTPPPTPGLPGPRDAPGVWPVPHLHGR